MMKGNVPNDQQRGNFYSTSRTASALLRLRLSCPRLLASTLCHCQLNALELLHDHKQSVRSPPPEHTCIHPTSRHLPEPTPLPRPSK
ncbi:hypothetical protein BDQ17DRAFT_813053 [Cyathus striatus]|nr:hypothetical protein BDQ17DRAFT_813053 [Cyathus striatus]